MLLKSDPNDLYYLIKNIFSCGKTNINRMVNCQSKTDNRVIAK